MISTPIARRSDLIGDLLSIGARRNPNRMLFGIEGGVQRTWAEVNVRASQIANALLGHGLVQGDRIAVWSDDTVEYLETYMAAARAGLVVVPVNNRLTPHEAKFLIEDSGAQCLMFSDRMAPSAVKSFDSGDFSVTVSYGAERELGAVAFEDLVAQGRDSEPPRPDEESLYIIAYTSGTTGFPKGAMITHRSLKNLARMNAASYHLQLGSVAAYTGSMSFASTVCAFAMSHLYMGGSMSLLGKWDPERAVDMIIRRRANFVYVPTPAIDEFCDAITARPQALDSLITVLHSASKAKPATLRRLGETVSPRLVEGWGMTEISGGILTATSPQDFTEPCEALDLYDSAGRVTVDAEVEIVDEQRQPLPHDGVSEGEFAVRSASMMAGYWGRPEATAEVIKDGWYYAGDVGTIDPAGYVYVRERRVDLIVSGGMNIYPSEVEDVISQMPEVAEVAVVAAPHARYGHTVAAVIVPAPGAHLTVEDVIAFSRTRLASYKKPTIVVFAEELPRTVSMKVKRQAIRKELFGDHR